MLLQVHADNFVQADGKNMALPLTKIRRLPAWMTSLARSSDFIMHKSVEVEPGGKTGQCLLLFIGLFLFVVLTGVVALLCRMSIIADVDLFTYVC